jgi:pectate lyase
MNRITPTYVSPSKEHHFIYSDFFPSLAITLALFLPVVSAAQDGKGIIEIETAGNQAFNSSETTPLKSFPGAEGFGAFASGGRGGNIIKVTTLAASGPGSLQWAINQPEARIIVFDVSGIITSDIHIPQGNVTIAGQTAPGAGITIVGHLYTTFGDDTSNIIIRHIRVRPPNPNTAWPPNQHDGIQFSTANTIMLDHIDVSHGADENIDFWGGAHHITVQWSNISFPIYDPANGWVHHKGILNHRPCLDNASCDSNSRPGGFISIHHNLFIHNRNRTPALSVGPADIRNNVVYNGREGFVHHNIVSGEFNIIGNHYIAGPSASLVPFWFDPENNTLPIPTSYWLQNNLVEDLGVFTGNVNNPYDNNFSDIYSFANGKIDSSQFNQTGAFDFSSQGQVNPHTHDSDSIEALLIEQAGAFPRDIVARKSLTDLQNRGGNWDNYRPADLMEGLTTTSPPIDSDDDGMPDTWEASQGLDPNNSTDHITIMPSGYTAIEEYINALATTNNTQDTDGDGILDTDDNCTLIANTNQRDTDEDGFGNVCDADLNNDGNISFSDLDLFRARFGSTDPDADFDGNGSVSFADLDIFRSLFGQAPGPAGDL